jgi:hypothetical protein
MFSSCFALWEKRRDLSQNNEHDGSDAVFVYNAELPVFQVI